MTYSIKMVKAGTSLASKKVGEGPNGQPTLIAAQPGVTYVISQGWDAYSTQKGAPKKLLTQREGNNLKIALDAKDAAYPDIVIKDYFLYPAAPISGVGIHGEAFSYGAVDAKSGGSEPVSADVAIAGAADSTTTLVDMGTLPSGAFAALGTAGQLGLLGGGLLLLGAAKGSGGGGSDPVATPASSPAVAAQAALLAFARSGTSRTPTLADYTALGVTGVSSANLAAINSALDALTESAVDSKDKVQSVVDAYTRVLAAARTSTAPWVASSVDPTVTDLTTIGASIGTAGKDGLSGRTTDSQQAAALTLLDSFIARVAGTAVDTIQEINDLAKVVDKLMLLAKGSNPTEALTKEDLTLLGITGVTAENLPVIVEGIKASRDDGTEIASVKQLQTVVSQFVIAAYADQDSNPAPTLQDYANVSSALRVDSTNLAAINDAVRSLSKADVDTSAELQNVVDAYRKILVDAKSATDASGRTSATDPTLLDFRSIGVTTGKAVTTTDTQQAAALNLMDDVLIRKASTAVDTISEINAFMKSIDKVMGLAKGVDPTDALSVADLTSLGVANVGADNLAAIAQQIKSTDDLGTGVDTVQELQAVVSYGTILGYANNSSSATAPTMADYTNVGVSNSALTTGTLSAINSIVHALPQASVDTVGEISNIITSWERIASEANGSAADTTPANPLASDYALIGLGASTMLGSSAAGTGTTTTLGASALDLLNSAIGLKQRTDITRLSDVTDLERIVEKVMTLANVADNPGATVANNVSGLTSADLTKLGLSLASNVNENNPAKWNKLVLLIANSSVDGVNTLDELQAIASSQAVLSA